MTISLCKQYGHHPPPFILVFGSCWLFSFLEDKILTYVQEVSHWIDPSLLESSSQQPDENKIDPGLIEGSARQPYVKNILWVLWDLGARNTVLSPGWLFQGKHRFLWVQSMKFWIAPIMNFMNHSMYLWWALEFNAFGWEEKVFLISYYIWEYLKLLISEIIKLL